MPADREIHLGFIGPDAIYRTIDALGLQVLDWEDEMPTTTSALRSKPFDLFEFDEQSYLKVNAVLREAYQAVAARLGWTFIGTTDNDYMIYDTPYGRRQTGGFSICLTYDPDEIGDEPQDATIGIDLSSRYSPAVLDIESAHGGMRSVIEFEELQPRIEACREEIVKRLPAFTEAKIFIREIFY